MLMVPVTFLVSSCATLDPELTCDGPSSTPVTVHYGDSQLWVTPPQRKVHRRGNFTLTLQPSPPRDFAGVNVTVVGKTAADKAWIPLKKDTYKNAPNKRIVYCVPENQAIGIYKYEIIVDEVGTLDPRVDVGI